MEKPLPHSSWCYVCGADNPIGHHIVFQTNGQRVRAYYTPEAHRQGYRGVVHGGVLCTILDETMGWAPALTRDRMHVTGELSVRFIKPFPVGSPMIVEAWTEKVTSRLALVSGEVRDEAGQVYAKAKGKFLPMTEEETRAVDEQLIYKSDTLALFKGNGSPRQQNPCCSTTQPDTERVDPT